MLHLASQSPRRRELLARLGIDFRVLAIDVPECRQPGESPVDYVRRVARDKARAGLSAKPEGLILAADTEVVLDDVIYGKPDNADAAREMLARLSGRRHDVVTAVALRWNDDVDVALSISHVTLRRLAAGEIERYVATGEPFDKAGGYAIQGRAAVFVTRLEGSYSGVMGLPLAETAALLARSGHAVL